MKNYKNHKKETMKKNLLFMLSFVAVALMASCNKQPDKMEAKAGAANVEYPENGMRIAYVNVDSVQNNYELCTLIGDSLLAMEMRRQKRMNDMQSDLEYRSRKFENDYKQYKFQSEDEVKRAQQQIVNVQQAYEKEAAELTKAMEEKAQELQKIIKDSVNNFLEDYNAEKGYDLILRNEVLLIGQPQYDITQDVINGLNARYKK